MSYFKKFLAITLIFVMQFQSVHASVAIGGGWSLGNSVVNGATTTWEAVKNGVRSTVAISPSSAQVAKNLVKGGLVGLAMSAVTQALLDGVDYVMDPAKQELKYKLKTCVNSSSCIYIRYSYFTSNWPQLGYASSINTLMNNLSVSAQKYYRNTKVTVKFLEYADNDLSKLQGCPGYFEISYNDSRGDSRDYSQVCRKYEGTYKDSADKTIPLTTLATQIINLAEQGNPDAKAYIASVVQDMLEHDEDYRKSLEAQLDAKLKEAQSIGSNNGNNNNGGNSNSGNNSATKPVPSTSGNSTTANPTPPNNDDEEDANQKIDNLLKKTNQVKKAPEDAKSTNNNIYERIGHGGFDQVMKDFNSLGLKNIRTVRSNPNDTVTIGQLRNNQWVTARSYSEDGRPTLEIAKRNIKIRY
ncbi:hypothetical protein OZX61_07275 [Acinetobacter sp. ESL0695]|uniref:hypothetical protein n=1 Tax=Acinetobacter sp. ESL0695 TaxID=2983215 RepID=UPI0023F5646D|nr:hypothetical protein [Acinetobacter sp. ESL0695]WEV48090.1 hypothetical protein OZX61_07275 [Acinetobacter sp. ESL0695]